MSLLVFRGIFVEKNIRDAANISYFHSACTCIYVPALATSISPSLFFLYNPGHVQWCIASVKHNIVDYSNL